MSDEHPGIDHAIVNRDLHGGHVRIVPIEEVDAAVENIKFLFPHDVVLTTPMGCRHMCIFTDHTPASFVAEYVHLHLRDIEHRTI